MYKATRELIKARQIHTDYVVEVVPVKQVGGGIANQCFQNATNDEMLSKGNKVVSGWIVNAYDRLRDTTAIIQHWWNINAEGNYFDITPGLDPNVEYVIDCEIAAFGQDNFDSLDNLVALSLLLKDGKFFGVDENLNIIPIISLSTKNLFELNELTKPAQ
jgi:hypothetical protein